MNRRRPSKQDHIYAASRVHADRTPEEIAAELAVSIEGVAAISYGAEAKRRMRDMNIPEPSQQDKETLLSLYRTAWEQCGPGVIFLPSSSDIRKEGHVGVAFLPMALVEDEFPASVVAEIGRYIEAMDYHTTFILVRFFDDLGGLMAVHQYRIGSEGRFIADVSMA